MTVNSVGGSTWSYQPAPVASASQTSYASVASSVQPHRFGPHDPLNQYLTDGDRATIKSTTGIDVRPDGDILSPMSMGVNEYGASLDSVGQIAADRGNGTQSGAISADYLRQMISQFAEKIAKNADEFGGSGLNVVA